MPQPEDIRFIAELNPRTLQALRVANGVIEAGGECMLENKASLEALLTAVSPSWKTGVIKASASIWPDATSWHVSTDTEAMLDRTADALTAIALASPGETKEATAFAVCGAVDGSAVTPDGLDKWVMASAPAELMRKAASMLDEMKIVTDVTRPAAFSRISAVIRALRLDGKGSVVLWDLGTAQSQLLLVTGHGVEAAVPCDVGLNSIFEAVQVALRLKFRGAGERLFFNETYDFTEAGPKVAAVVASKLKLALSELTSPEAPAFLSSIGIPGKQSWFVREVAAAAGLSAWEPDLERIAADLGLTFSDGAPAGSFSACTLGLLASAAGQNSGSESWQPSWVVAEAPEEEAPPAPIPEERPKPEPVIEPLVRAAPPPVRMRPALAPEAHATPTPAVAKAAKPPVPTRPPGAPPVARGMSFSAVPSPAAPQPSAEAAAPAPSPAPQPAPRPPISPRPASQPGGRSATPVPESTSAPTFSRPGFAPPEPGEEASAGLPLPPSATPPDPGMKIPVPTPAAAPTVTALPFEAVKPKLGTQTAATQPAPAEEAPPKSRVGFYIGVGVAAALIFAVIAVVLDARMEKAKAYDLEQQEALAHHVAEQRLKEAEQSAKEELERSRKELETAIEITKKQTEAETRRKLLAEIEAERLAKAPGAIVLSTVPSGAQVSIDGAAPVTSPVRQDGIAPGAHHIRVTLDGHDPVELAADVKGSKTTDLGTVTLPTALGELDLTSSPDDLEYAVRRDDDPQGKPLRTGRTPAEIADLPHGNYTVTFMRPGCRDHVEKAEVAKGSKTPVGTRYLDGSLELASDPSGAWVDKEGTRLGTTPLILHDLTPKTANFELTLPGYDPTPVSCEIPEGQTLKLDAKLLRRDRVFTPAEVKTQPTSYESPQPSLSATQRRAGGTVTLSLIVRQDGSVSDVAVVKASDDDIARRCKAALEAWKYHPATAPDDRQVDARIEVSFKFMAQNP